MDKPPSLSEIVVASFLTIGIPICIALADFYSLNRTRPKPDPPMINKKEEASSAPQSPYPFAQNCESMQDYYNSNYKTWYETGDIDRRITFSMFEGSRFRVVNGSPICSKGLTSIETDTYDKINSNSNMIYLAHSPKKTLEWGGHSYMKYDKYKISPSEFSETSCVKS